ncbi:hypothetical protein A1O1_02630 [Capronia coronata CBS 617.96]|uniref:Uncharacterized protein n=1 Tax=Capronia coronata CBS 617.96 TaxID=1182541 RepID=W9YMT2_9EURO|nr:uncharacterized protein A1O1_02630 [Capronia coronata CBS 617.96]EXJ94237.1 hypothetical protein A1O1_02630 [Capronia coronata CBS 617.96]
MAHLEPTNSGYASAAGASRRDYSTPLPFAYSRQPSRAQPPPVVSDEDGKTQRHAPQAGPVRPCVDPQAQEAWLLSKPPSKQPVRAKKGGPEIVIPVRGPSLPGLSAKKVNRDKASQDAMMEPPALNISRPSLRTSGPVKSQQSESGLGKVFRDGVMHQMKRKGSVAYEHVDGVSMDTHPAASTSEYGTDEPIPEIEARDVNEIQRPAEYDYPIYDDSEEDHKSPARSPLSSASDRGDSPSRQWSGTSNSTSATSTSGESAAQTEQLSPLREQRSSHDDSMQLYADAVIHATGSAAPYAHLEGNSPVAAGAGRKVELDVIKEEDGESIYSGRGDAAPSPAVKGVKDAECLTTGTLQHLLPSGAKAATEGKTANTDGRSIEGNGEQSPPRVLAAPGIGNDPHIYELEATSLTRESSDPSSPSRNGTLDESVADSASSESSRGTGLAGAVHHKISTAAHALEEKVKKSVSFSPVEDVRFLTPLPSRLGEGTRHDVNQAQRHRLR